ncbi:hypothetical protein HY639_03870 [Candidatus Woesearchaeota archaeon]|nr:hypothetical protein [Candidatus Woesearchaeota archaeon]
MKKLLLLFSVMFIALGCQPDGLPPGPGDIAKEGSIPVGQVYSAQTDVPDCYGGPNAVAAKPEDFAVSPSVVSLDRDGKATVSLTIAGTHVWQKLEQHLVDEKGALGWFDTDWYEEEKGASGAKTGRKKKMDRHPANTKQEDCDKPKKQRSRDSKCWLNLKKVDEFELIINANDFLPVQVDSQQLKASNVIKCKNPANGQVIKAAVFGAYTPKGNQKWLVQLVEVKECTAGQTKCDGTGAMKTCGTDGSWPATATPCTGGTCDATQQKCVVAAPPECTAGEKKCEGTGLKTCGADNKWPATATPCPSGACNAVTKQCVPVQAAECTAGQTKCEGTTSMKTCGADSKWPATATPCLTGQACDATQQKCVAEQLPEGPGEIGAAAAESCTTANAKRCALDAQGNAVVQQCKAGTSGALTFQQVTLCGAGKGCINVFGPECVAVGTTVCTADVCEGDNVRACALVRQNDKKASSATLSCPVMCQNGQCI